MDVGWAILITVIVFLIVVLVAWGLRVKPITAVALACIWTLIIQAVLFPSLSDFNNLLSNIDNKSGSSGWLWFYGILAIAFTIYLIFYITYMATRDHEPKGLPTEEELLELEM